MGLVWFGLVRSSLSQQFHFSVCAPLAHLMNVRHGILNFNCCNGIVVAVAAAAAAILNDVYVQNSCTFIGKCLSEK